MPRTPRTKVDPDDLSAIAELIDSDGSISIDPVYGVGCVAAANDESRCYAMLVRRPAESFADLLKRLDAAIAEAVDTGIAVDEVNPPTPPPTPRPARRSRR
jgi:hypothetical protein